MDISLSDKQKETIFIKMFAFVNEPYNVDFMKIANWNLQKEWNRDAFTLFKSWLIKYFQQTNEMKKNLATKAAEWFLLTYGWRIKS